MAQTINFEFSQNNLQDYIDCPRRFELRYILHQRCPALPSEPVLEQERHVMLGKQFHEMIHQFFLGIEIDQIASQVNEPQLLDWWSSFLETAPLPENIFSRRAETNLTTVVENARLVAKIDLLLLASNNHVIIIDWKTNLKIPSDQILKARMQSKIYPYIVFKAAHFDNFPVQPNQIEMVYWFTSSPKEPRRFDYSQDQMENDEILISSLIRQIRHTESGQFHLSPDLKRCAFCTYRSLCNRGVKAGDWLSTQDEEEDKSAAVEFEQISEIEF